MLCDKASGKPSRTLCYARKLVMHIKHCVKAFEHVLHHGVAMFASVRKRVINIVTLFFYFFKVHMRILFFLVLSFPSDSFTFYYCQIKK